MSDSTAVEQLCRRCGERVFGGVIELNGKYHHDCWFRMKSEQDKAAESPIDQQARQLWMDVAKEVVGIRPASEVGAYADAVVAEFRKRFDPNYKESGHE